MNIAKSPATNLIAQDILTQHQDLHSQIMALRFDDGFLPRLLRETDWTVDQCDRTLQEYRRFLFLHRTANHTVIPSQMVDKVWHLHLLYTRSYWEDLCDNILKTPLHHHPGSATGEQRHFFWGNYEATLKSYETTFHHAPPADIWPSPARQFPRLKPTNSRQITQTKPLNLTMPKFPSWVYKLALIACITAIALQINIIATLTQLGFASSLKYGLALLAIFYAIQFLIAASKTIRAANRLTHIPLTINPKTRRESDIASFDMSNLDTTETHSSSCILISCRSAIIAAYIQACQTTDSLFLYSNDHWWLWMFSVSLLWGSATVIAKILTGSISNKVLQKLKHQENITVPRRSPTQDWQTAVYNHRPRICQDCKSSMGYLELNNLEQFLTEKEQFAQTLNSIDITHSHDHCPKCSPPPTRENLRLKVAPINNYSRCLKCTTIASKTTITILEEATTSHEGKELISQDCAYCHDHKTQTRKIPKIEETCNDCCM